jgi:hypothetical protein
VRRQEISVRRFSPIVVSIEMFCNTKIMTVEALVGHLRVAEECLDDTIEQIIDKAGCLMLAEEEWLEWNKHRLRPAQNKEGGGSSGGGYAKNKQAAALAMSS